MTLIDSRPGLAAAYRALAAATGTTIDVETVVGRLGPPLRWELANWYPPEQVAAMVEQFRALYPDHAVEPSTPMPGALDALAAVHASGARVLVVTSKLGRLAQLHVDRLGLPVDHLVGDLFAEGKAAALLRYGAVGYVGDHVADMVAARTAGVPGIGVTTGPCTRAELFEAGADAVLDTLAEFPGRVPHLLTH